VAVAGLDAIAVGPGELAAGARYLAPDPQTQGGSTTLAPPPGLPPGVRGDPRAPRGPPLGGGAPAPPRPHPPPPTPAPLPRGERQRVALAAALVTRPRLVLLDEPTSQLAPVAGDELIWLLRRLNEEWGVTILLAEHRLERCLPAADRVIAMDAGTIAFD